MACSNIAISPLLCTSKLSHIAPNYVPLKHHQKNHLPFHKLESFNPIPSCLSSSTSTSSSSSSSSSSVSCFPRSQIHVKTFSSPFSSSASSGDDNNNTSSSSSAGKDDINNDDNNDDHDMHMSINVDDEASDVSNDDGFFVFFRYVFGLLSFLFQQFHGKQQVIHGLFKYLMRSLGDNVEFVVKPTLQHGINVGFTWKFQWSKTHFPFGEGFNFYILQTYQGKFLIRNLEMLVEVLPLHIEPIRLRFVAFMMDMVHSMEGLNLSQDKMKRAMVALLLIVIVLLFLSPEIY